MKRSSSRVWVVLGVATVVYAAAVAAARRFPAASVQPASVELRERLASLKAFDAGALAKVRAERESFGSADLSPVRAAEIQSQFARSWETTALPVRPVGDLSIVSFALRGSGGWREQLAALREVQQVPGVSVSAASVSARGSVLSVELQVAIVAHTQPADDKASRLPAVVRPPQIH